MHSLKPTQWAGLMVAGSIALYVLYAHLRDFGNVSFLITLLLIELVIISLWKFEERFFLFLMIAFVWAGMHVPMQNSWTMGRWVALSAGAVVGSIVWMKNARGTLGSVHLLAFFCVAAAFASATVSPFTQMACYKAFSLLLLFTYCTFGARVGVVGREERFFQGLLLAGEIAVYTTAICYFGIGEPIWGNPNSLGASMSIGLFPVLLWGWFTANGPVLRYRRLVTLLLCTYLITFSMARAGMASMVLVTVTFCLCLHQYRLLIKITGFVLALIAFTGMLAPAKLNQSLGDFKDAVLYKHHKEAGVLGSRRGPWEASIATIKQHPLFGTGYGTSPNGEDPGITFGKFASTAETAREHGSSYMTIAEWVGLMGVVPFLGLLALTIRNVYRVCVWMHRTSDSSHYAIPLALVMIAGLVHASFEDWLFAVGAYPCIYFWVFAFVLADLAPSALEVPAPALFARVPAAPAGFGAVAPNR